MIRKRLYKIISVVMCLTIFLGIYEPNRAIASPLVLAPEMVEMVLAGAAAAGVEVTDSEKRAPVAEAIWEGLNNTVRSAYEYSIANAIDGIASLYLDSDVISGIIAGNDNLMGTIADGWEYTQSGEIGESTTVYPNGYNWVSSALPHIQDGSVSVTGNIPLANNGSATMLRMSDAEGDTSCNDYLEVSVYKHYFSTFTQGAGVRARVIINGAEVVNTIIRQPIADNYDPWTGTMGVILSAGEASWLIDNESIWESTQNTEADGYLGSVGYVQVNDEGYVTYSVSGTLTGTLTPTDVEYDEQKKVAFPPNGLGNNLNVPLDGASNTTVSTPGQTVTVPGAETFVEQVLGRIESALKQGLTNIGNVLTQIKTIVTTIATTLTGWFKLEGEIDWTPLQLSGTALKTVFPFSLPWDLYNLISALEGTEWNGIIDVDFVVMGSTYDIAVNLQEFDTVRGYAKTMNLFLFDIGLLLATRKLLGGDV